LSQLNSYELIGLVGLLRAPNRFQPNNSPKAFVERQEQLAKKLGIKNKPLCLRPINLNIYKKQRLSSILRHELAQNNIDENEVRSIKTTIDVRIQSSVDKIIAELSNDNSVAEIAVVVIDNKTGNVLVEAASQKGKASEFSPTYFGHLQPGSTFRTFTLISAIEHGMSLDSTLLSAPFCSTKFNTSKKSSWLVRNFAHKYRGEITLIDALVHSDNTIFSRLTELLNPDSLFDVYRRFGLLGNSLPTPAIALGSINSGINLLSLANAYRTIANDGVFSKPSIFTEVSLRNGTAIHPSSENSRLVLVDSITTQIKFALAASGKAASSGRFSGKTGTTKKGQIFSGYNEDISLAIWVNHSSPQSELEPKGLSALTVLSNISDSILGHNRGILFEII